MSKVLTVSGAILLSSGAPACGSGSGSCPTTLAVSQTPTMSAEFDRTINSPVTWIDLLTATGISLVTFLSIKSLSSSIEVRFSTPLAADQVLRLSDVIMLSNRLSGSELTALSVRGTGQIEVLIAGN